MAQNLNQVPPGAEVWQVGDRSWLVYYQRDTEPPIPLLWEVRSAEEAQALGISRPDRTFDSMVDLWRTGALPQGETIQLANTTEDPWNQLVNRYEREVRVKPWLADPEILALWYAAALEGRPLTTGELQTTDWWRTRSEAERQWLALNAQDPATAAQRIADNRAQVLQMFQQLGVNNASEDLIDLVADQWTTGAWSEVYATNQIRLLADPHMEGTLDALIVGFRDGLDTTRAREDDVRALLQRWLGPALASGYSDEWVAAEAGKLRNDTDYHLELETKLRNARKALLPEYEDANLTYEDIASPWRGVVQQMWGQIPDETDPEFLRIIRANDLYTVQAMLREKGIERGVGAVVDEGLDALMAGLGGQVRRTEGR